MSDENLREITISSAPVIFSPYTNNRVSCCRYSWLNFLPKSIYYQFSNIALIYFVFLCIIDFYSSSSYSISSSLVIPLLILILFNLIKDAIYMISCKRQDEHLNSKLFRVWNGVEFLNTRSDKILVGHIIKIYEGQKAPADILILCSANNNGSFYVDFTEAIGISDIKNNYALHDTQELLHEEELEEIVDKLSGRIKFIEPNNDYNYIHGKLSLDKHPRIVALNSINMLYRSTKLYGTKFVIGIVLYAGFETKFFFNLQKQGKKYGSLYKNLGNLMIILMLIFITLVVFCTVMDITTYHPESDALEIIKKACEYISQFSIMIPVMLFIYMNIIRLLQIISIKYKMNDNCSIKNIESNESLGQIEYIVSNSSGILTENYLHVQAFVVGMIIYQRNEYDLRPQTEADEVLIELNANQNSKELNFDNLKCRLSDEEVKEFFISIILCNSVIPMQSKDSAFFGVIKDEVSIVETCEEFKIILLSRDSSYVKVDYYGKIIEFNIVAYKQGKNSRILIEKSCARWTLYVRGNDEKMLPLLELEESCREELIERIQSLRAKGLRLSILASKNISGKELEAISAKINNARSFPSNSDKRIEKVFKQLEQNLNYIGICGIEDEIMQDTELAVSQLMDSGIKIWIASGEKKTPTISSCRRSGIFTNDHKLVYLTHIKTYISCLKKISKAISKHIFLEEFHETSQVLTIFEYKTSKAGIIEGNSSEILSPNLSLHTYSKMHEEEQFNHQISFVEDNINKVLDKCYEYDQFKFIVIIDKASWKTAVSHPSTFKMLACLLFAADSVIFYKLASQDKADVVKLLKNNFKFRPNVLSVGHGEGDIPMMQAADVGVSIQKGTHLDISCYSDIILRHFSLLRDLLLFHGLWNVSRMSRIVLLFIYKNLMLILVSFYYLWLSEFSSHWYIDFWFILFYNVLLTSLSFLALGLDDERFTKSTIVSYTSLYSLGIQNQEFSKLMIFYYITLAIIDAIIIFITLYSYLSHFILNENGYTEDYELFGTSTYIAIVITALLEIFHRAYLITNLLISVNAFSICLLIIIILIRGVQSFSPILGIPFEILNCPTLLLLLFTIPLVCFIINYIISEFFMLFSHYKQLNRSKQYQASLASVYRKSKFNRKAAKEIYDIKKYSMRFFSPYIEKMYELNYITTNLKFLRIIILILWGFLIAWTVIEFFLYSYSEIYLIIRVTLSIIYTITMLLSWTSLFHKYYRRVTFIAILSALASKFLIEIAMNYSSLLSTATIPSITFILFNVDWMKISFLNLLSLIFYIMYSILCSPYVINTFIISRSISLLIAILLTSSLIARTLESTRRQEFKLLRVQEMTYEKTQRILGFLLPDFIKKRVKDGIRYIAEDQGIVTVVFCDIVDFDFICAEYSPTELTAFLDAFFQKLDVLCNANGVSKIETVGKTYMACAGLKDSESEMDNTLRYIPHAKRTLSFALAIIEESCKFPMKNGRKLEVKIGMHSGPVMAGVVGYHKPQFSLVGDTVNTASRMCSTLELGNSIQFSTETYVLIPDISSIKLVQNRVFAKGKGLLKTYMFSANNPSEYWNFLDEITSFRTCTALNSVIHSERTEVKSVTKEKGLMRFLDDSFRTDTQFLQKTKWYKCSYTENNKELRFRIDKLENNKGVMQQVIIISLINFTINIILYLIDSIKKTQYYFEVLCLRTIVILLLLLLILLHKRIYKYRLFPLCFLFILILMLCANLSENIRENSISDLSTLEIMYLMLLLNHSVSLSFKGILWFTPLMYIPWLGIAINISPNINIITSSLFIIICAIINSSAVYSREAQLLKYFNLKALTEKDMAKTEKLLTQMLPPHVLEYMKNNKSITDKLYDVTLLYADIVGFTQWSSNKTPKEVVEMLSRLFSRFDKLCVIHKIYKVHTIGDCYVAMGYLDSKNRDPKFECQSIINMALSMISVINRINLEEESDLKMRIGIHTGNVIAGIIGTNIVRYDIYGPDVLIANKMESCGEAGKINVSDATKYLIEGYTPGSYEFAFNKEIVLRAINRTHNSYFLTTKNN